MNDVAGPMPAASSPCSAAHPYGAWVLRVFTEEQIQGIEEAVLRVILAGCGYGRLTLVWANGRLVEQNCAEEKKIR